MVLTGVEKYNIYNMELIWRKQKQVCIGNPLDTHMLANIELIPAVTNIIGMCFWFMVCTLGNISLVSSS